MNEISGKPGNTAPPPSNQTIGQSPDLRRNMRAVIVASSWWRRNFANNFALEFELEAKIDLLKIRLKDLGEKANPVMTSELKDDLQAQLDLARTTLEGRKPLEPVMRRINFVEREIIRRLADEHVGEALEVLRAQVNTSLPEPARAVMLQEIDKAARPVTDVATDGGANAPAPRPVPTQRERLVGLKSRLNEAIIELFRGSERVRNATLILGGVLIALTLNLGLLLLSSTPLSHALFTHYETTAVSQPREPATASARSRPAIDEREDAVVEAVNPPRMARPIHVQAPLMQLAFQVMLMAAALDGIGACLSGLFSFTLQDRVPTEYEGTFRTLIRPVIGIASGFLAVFILRSGIFTFGDDLAWIAIVALVFGFSERLFIGTMARLESLHNK